MDYSLQNKIESLESQIANLEKEREELSLVIQNTGVGIWDWYVQTGETVFNDRWANIIGYTLEELSPVSIETWVEYAHPADLEESNRLLKEHWEGNSEYYIFESRMKHKNGDWVWVLDTGRVIEWESDGVPKRMIGTHIDITEQKNTLYSLAEANKKLEELIRIDELTKVPNRRAYDERLDIELNSANRTNMPLSMLLIDIDYFKAYNDTYGHHNGDVALIRIANHLKSSLRRKSDFLARYGGEEFAILLPQTGIEVAENIAADILKFIFSLGIDHSESHHEKKITISIGIASTENNLEDLFNAADQALYKAKSNGRNRYEVFQND